jgi:predicted lipase
MTLATVVVTLLIIIILIIFSYHPCVDELYPLMLHIIIYLPLELKDFQVLNRMHIVTLHDVIKHIISSSIMLLFN